MTATDLTTLLGQCRTHPGEGMRGILADAIRDTDGDSPATAQLGTALACERCGCPDSPRPMALDRVGKWHVWDDVHSFNSGEGLYRFGEDFPDPVQAVLVLYRWDRWRLLCPGCRRSVISCRANATRRASLADRPDLFSEVSP